MSGQTVAWHAEHLNVARLLRLFEEQVMRFAADEAPDYDLVRDVVFYLNKFPDVHHHRYESEAAKAATAAVAAVAAVATH